MSITKPTKHNVIPKAYIWMKSYLFSKNCNQWCEWKSWIYPKINTPAPTQEKNEVKLFEDTQPWLHKPKKGSKETGGLIWKHNLWCAIPHDAIRDYIPYRLIFVLPSHWFWITLVCFYTFISNLVNFEFLWVQKQPKCNQIGSQTMSHSLVSSPKTEHKMESWLLLNVVVGQSPPILKLFPWWRKHMKPIGLSNN